MNEHLTAKQRQQYLERMLGGADLIRVSDHLAECVECRAALSSEFDTDQKVTTFARDLLNTPLEHLTYEQLVNYANGVADPIEREIVESHTESCVVCAAELQEFRTLQRALSNKRDVQQKRWTMGQGLSMAAALAVLGLVAALLWRTSIDRGTADEKREITSPAPRVQPEKAQPEQTDVSIPMIATIQDGGRSVALDEAGVLHGLDSLEPNYRRVIIDSLQQKRIPVPFTVTELQGTGETLLGKEDETFLLTDPVGTVVRSARPTFRWQTFKGASSYKVTITDTQFEQVAGSPELDSTFWNCSRTLERGKVYLWQVTAIKDSESITAPAPPLPAAKFRVLDTASLAEIERLEKEHAGSSLVLSVVYAHHGLLSEAQEQIEVLSQSNPNSPIVAGLKQSLRKR